MAKTEEDLGKRSRCWDADGTGNYYDLRVRLSENKKKSGSSVLTKDLL